MFAPLAAAASEDASAIDLILPAGAELVYGTIAFAIIFLTLRRFAFPAMNTALDNRAAAIQGKMEEAERSLQEAEQAKRDYEAQIADAEGEASRIVDEAKATAEALRRDIVAKAESEAQAIRERAQADVAAERERTLQELRSQVGSLSVELAEKIVQKELDAGAHADLVDQYINRLGASN